MKRLNALLLVFLALTLVLSACAPATPAAPQVTSTPEQITVVDGEGSEVRLNAPAQKIISLAPSNTELLFALGAGGQIIARDDFSNYPQEAASIASVGGDMGKYNLEEIARLQPDLILTSPLMTPEGVQSLKTITPNVFVVPNPKGFDDLFANIKNVGALSGRSAEAEALASDLSGRVKAVEEKVAQATAKPKVFYELDATEPSKPWTAGPGTFIDVAISAAGGQNVGASLQGEWAQISQEELIVQNPDFILLGDATYGGVKPADVAARPGWDAVAAVKNNQVFEFNDDLVSRPGPRMVEGLEEMAKIFHPELFK